MLILRGILRSASQTAGGTNRQTGEVRKPSSFLQIESSEGGRISIVTLYVPDHRPYLDKVGQTLNVPVRAWSPSRSPINLSFDADGVLALQDKPATLKAA